MMVIATTNLAISIKMQQSSEVNVETIRQAYNRLSLMSQNQVLLRSIINNANEFEPNQSRLSQDRFADYVLLQKDAIDRLQTAHRFLESSSFKKFSFFENYVEGKNTLMEYFGKTTKDEDLIAQMETLDIAMNIFISKAIEINNYQKWQIQGDTYIQRVGGSRNGQVPDQYERTIFVVIQNGIRKLRRMLTDMCYLYQIDAQKYSAQDLSTALITMLVSIATIIGIGLIITPMLTLSETRRYSSLSFFFKVPSLRITQLITASELFNTEFEKSLTSAQQAQKEQEKKSKKLFKQQSSLQNDTLLEVQTYSMISSKIPAKKNSKKMHGHSEDEESKHQEEGNSPQIQEEVRRAFVDKKQMSKMQKTMLTIKDQQQQQMQGEDDDKESNSSNSQSKDEVQYVKGGKEQHDMTDKEREVNNIEYLAQYTKKRRINMISYMLGVITTLTSYFIIQYFLSIRIFSNAGAVVNDLQVIFFKSSCFDLVMGFYREDLIRNQTFKSNDPGVLSDQAGYQGIKKPEGSAFQLHYEFCAGKEEDYRELRRFLPDYFNEIQEFINDIESSKMCDLIFVGDLEDKNQPCKIALDGLTDQGLSNSMTFMFSKMVKQKLIFDKLGSLQQRDENALREMLADPTVVEMLDFKLLVLDRALRKLNNMAKGSVDKYIKNLLNQFQAVFIVFAVLLSVSLVAFLIFGFQKLKVRMLETNMILRIIPYETLQPYDREKVKEFFNQ